MKKCAAPKGNFTSSKIQFNIFVKKLFHLSLLQKSKYDKKNLITLVAFSTYGVQDPKACTVAPEV